MKLDHKLTSAGDAKRWIEANQVKYVLAQFVDIHGSAKTKAVPATHFEEILTSGAGFAAFAIWGMGIGPHGPDYMAKGDLSTLSLIPWMPGYARIVCDGHVNDAPHQYCSRVILKNQIKRLTERGLTMNTGIEPEFSLLVRDADGKIQPHLESDCLAKPCYDYKGLARTHEFLDKLTQSLIATGIDVYQIDHEDANGQFEINYTYTDCLTSADHYIFFKMAASEIAHSLGLVCSFMPKPFSHLPGNGTHMHISMSDARNGNLFQDKTDAQGLDLSGMAYHFLGGILKHARALTALACPSINSYKRLVVGRSLTGATWAPAYISYGNNNRSTMVRIPPGRLELRLPDGSTNPYLSTAALIAAGLDGLDNKIDPGAAQNENLYDYSPAQLKAKKIGLLPQNLNEALVALENDKVLSGALGEAFVGEFIELKRMEWVDYQRHVSDWEVKRYLEFF
ncbi:MAG: type III glutamate--ammonia ligase [Proteobacteria bacterium]|nr:type III glutamate--ammonia ligase [Pseudomonadota bacterium]MDE3208466.1 type III glutamate--ammonia ligase [Pseudomonadota bacterium]